ncbi:MAG TPA: acetate--CoA ligase family protein [Bacteroidales bacterium]|nr:acetate--CoA ligase family protein [Bacteroidales bacterium]
MINKSLINPASIVIVGGSDDLSKPGGKVLKNILDGNYAGDLFVVNPKSDKVQGIKSFHNPSDLPEVELAILAIAARYCRETVEILARENGTKAFIILSAGFGEESKEGAKLEEEIAEIISNSGGCLIGPNCIGMLCQSYCGVFTSPIPKLDHKGVDFVSGSGATAVFFMESAIPNGVTFSSVFSVGNSAQIGVEDVIKYLDESYVKGKSSDVKLLYIESIRKPQMLLKHASSLIRKGCSIAAIKAGTSEAGSRAASSHTGAMATPDRAVDALFRKAGIIRCYSRTELASVASVLLYPPPKGRNIAIVTHAGGPAVMITDNLSAGGMNVPVLSGKAASDLLGKLHPGSSVENPIDILATGKEEQLQAVLDACENDFDEIDAVIVIFGSPGLFTMDEIYRVLDEKMRTGTKPIYPVLPSLLTAGREVNEFIAKGRINFPDEVTLAKAFSRVMNNRLPAGPADEIKDSVRKKVRQVINNAPDGYLAPPDVQKLLDIVGIPRVPEINVSTESEVAGTVSDIGFPIAMKVVGPVHKSDVGGVSLNITDTSSALNEFRRMMGIKGTTAVLFQPMIGGIELFTGAKREEGFGHVIMCGLGGIFIEVLKDINTELVPLSKDEADEMIRSLKGYAILQGVRGKSGIDIISFREIIIKVSKLVTAAPEIYEMDLNPLIGTREGVYAVDTRIRLEKIAR